jgi:hypothetical protein
VLSPSYHHGSSRPGKVCAPPTICRAGISFSTDAALRTSRIACACGEGSCLRHCSYAAAAAVAWPAHQSCEDFSVSPRAAIHESPVPAKAVTAHGGSAYAPSFTSDPQLLHTTPIIAPPTSKMNSDPDEQAGVANDQVRSLDTGISSALPTSLCRPPALPSPSTTIPPTPAKRAGASRLYS